MSLQWVLLTNHWFHCLLVLDWADTRLWCEHSHRHSHQTGETSLWQLFGVGISYSVKECMLINQSVTISSLFNLISLTKLHSCTWRKRKYIFCCRVTHFQKILHLWAHFIWINIWRMKTKAHSHRWSKPFIRLINRLQLNPIKSQLNDCELHLRVLSGQSVGRKTPLSNWEGMTLDDDRYLLHSEPEWTWI